MPNWVANKLTIEGENSEEVLNSLLSEDKEEKGKLYFDFNKIIPMPEELNIISGTITDQCMALYLTSINPNIYYYGKDKVRADEYLKITQKICKDNTFNPINFMLPVEKIGEYEKLVFSHEEEGQKFDREKALAYGKQAVDNVMKYDATSWYEWQIKEWNCKWGACNSIIDGTNIWFDTAWSDVRFLIGKLSLKHSKNNFIYEYCEEQPGYYCGIIHIQNGHLKGGDLAEYSKGAYEMFFDFWGGEDDYIFDEKTGTYNFIENENEME